MVIFIILAFLALIPTNILAAEESITLTTYYPSPYGVYSEMRLYPKADASTPCDPLDPATQIGVMYYDNTFGDEGLKVCGGAPSVGWQKFSGYWTLSGTNLYPNELSWNIGIGTTSPTSKLDVSSGSSTSVAIFDNFGPSGGGGGELLLQHRDNSGNRVTYASVKGYATDGSTGTSGGALVFKTVNGTLAERARIDRYGNVGIGTTSPAAKLDIYGEASPTMLKIGSTSITNTIRLTANTIGQGDIDYNNGGAGTGQFNFKPEGTTVLSVVSSGNVGIGTASPSAQAQLEVNNMLRLTPRAGDPATWAAGTEGRIAYSASNDAIYHDNGSAWVSQSSSGPGSWTCTIRTTSTSFSCVAGCTATASCQSSEKVIAGGCSFSYSNAYFTSRNSPASGGQGWTCAVSGASGTLTAYADCCS